MTYIIADNVFIARSGSDYSTPISITRSWPNRLAGQAFVEANPLDGFVVAMSLDGPVIVGVTEVNPDGAFEITNIAEKYSTKELLVFGISRSAGVNYSVASRVKPVL